MYYYRDPQFQFLCELKKWLGLKTPGIQITKISGDQLKDADHKDPYQDLRKNVLHILPFLSILEELLFQILPGPGVAWSQGLANAKILIKADQNNYCSALHVHNPSPDYFVLLPSPSW